MWKQTGGNVPETIICEQRRDYWPKEKLTNMSAVGDAEQRQGGVRELSCSRKIPRYPPVKTGQ